VCKGSQQGGTMKGKTSAATLNKLRPTFRVYPEHSCRTRGWARGDTSQMICIVGREGGLPLESDRVVLRHAGGRARGQSQPDGPGLADSRPRRVMEPCGKLDHRGVNPTHTEPQPDTAAEHDTRETQPPTLCFPPKDTYPN